jgi:hypothetical protein
MFNLSRLIGGGTTEANAKSSDVEGDAAEPTIVSALMYALTLIN